MAEMLPTEVRRSVTVDAPVDDVWEVVIDDDERTGWFGGPTELTPEVGAPAHFTGPDGTRRSARIDSVLPGRHLGWTWWGDDDDGATSRVTIDLTPSPTGTRIDVVETPLQARACAFGGGGVVDPLLELEHRLLIRTAQHLRRMVFESGAR